MDLEEFKNTVETEFLKLLSQYLKTGKIKLLEAKEVTKEFLAFLPFVDKEDMRNKLKSFTEKHLQFNQVYITFLKKEDFEKTADLIGKMKVLIKENKIDEALNLIK
jgi:hypothetical protein